MEEEDDHSFDAENSFGCPTGLVFRKETNSPIVERFFVGFVNLGARSEENSGKRLNVTDEKFSEHLIEIEYNEDVYDAYYTVSAEDVY